MRPHGIHARVSAQTAPTGHVSAMVKPVVYEARNVANGHFYIGVTKRSLRHRKQQHIHDARRFRGRGYFGAALRKYGEENFVWTILVECSSHKEALNEEIRLIAENRPHYNIARGGQGGGYPKTLEQKQKIAKALLGKKHPPERAAKLRGKKRSPEVIEKLRQIGLRSSRIREYMHLGPQASSKPVVCVNTGKIFRSASAAATANKLHKSSVIEVCNRHPRRKTAGGMVFRYVSDANKGVEEVRRALLDRDTARKKRALSLVKPVLCTTYRTAFSSASAAALEYCVSRSMIAAVCNGRRQHTFGLRFAYATEGY